MPDTFAPAVAAARGNPDHLAANVAAGALRLSPDELARLESLHLSGE